MENSLSLQREKVRQLTGLLEITTDPEDRRAVRETLFRHQVQLILQTLESLTARLVALGVAAQ